MMRMVSTYREPILIGDYAVLGDLRFEVEDIPKPGFVYLDDEETHEVDKLQSLGFHFERYDFSWMDDVKNGTVIIVPYGDRVLFYTRVFRAWEPTTPGTVQLDNYVYDDERMQRYLIGRLYYVVTANDNRIQISRGE